MGIFKEKWQEGQLEGAGSVVVVDLLKSLVDVGGYQIVNIVQIARQIKTNKRPISWVWVICNFASIRYILSIIILRHFFLKRAPILRPSPRSKILSTMVLQPDQWPANKVRDTFLNFFKERGHNFGACLLNNLACTDSMYYYYQSPPPPLSLTTIPVSSSPMLAWISTNLSS